MNSDRNWLFGRRVAALGLVFLFSVVTPTAAFAQEANDEAAAAGAGLSTITTVGVLVATGVGVYLTIVLFKEGEKKRNGMKTYIQNNEMALRQDITMGGGATVDDLATAFGVPPERHEQFGLELRNRRAALLPLADAETIDEERAAQFIDIVQSAMGGDYGQTDRLQPADVAAR